MMYVIEVLHVPQTEPSLITSCQHEVKMKCHGPFSIRSVPLVRLDSFFLGPDSPLRSLSSYIHT